MSPRASFDPDGYPGRVGWVEDGVGLIPLGDNRFAKVDPDLVPVLSCYHWTVHRKAGWLYARRYASKRLVIYMHLHILGVRPPLHGDHINGDTLDNRRANLRLANAAQNTWNRRKPRMETTSRFKGVAWHPKTRKWM